VNRRTTTGRTGKNLHRENHTMKYSYAILAGLAIAVAGALSSCDNFTTTPAAVATPADTATPWTATVAFSPLAGTYPVAQSVVIYPNDTTAAVYYTTDGSIPTTASTLYKGAIPVTATTRIKAITVKGGVASVVNVAAYNISTTTIKPAAGTYTSAQNVSLSSTDPYATLYYTTDGSTPTRSSTMYSAAFPVSTTTTVNAIAVSNGVTSSVTSATYTFPLLFSPAAGTYTKAQNVTISTGTAGDTIYYTTDGTAPTTASTLYTGAIPVSSNDTIKAISVKGGKTSSVYKSYYAITVVSFSPAAGIFSTPQSVTIKSINSGDTIYYTTDGSNPSRSSTRYTGAVAVSASDTTTVQVKAISVNGANSSPVYKAGYQFIPWQSGVTYGSVSDAAGQAYKTVTIGSQTWMAENLDYAGSGTTPVGACYKESADSCKKYGRLYSWSQVMAGSATSATLPSHVQGICPVGWHVPADTEWSVLASNLGPAASAGAALKALQVGWKLNGTASGNGTDQFGFRALASGDSTYANPPSGFSAAGSSAFWWSTTQTDSATALSRSLYYNLNGFYGSAYDKSFGFAVRCVKD
jgi:uncharacterized protein (TIGR02145 family)